MKSQDLNYPTWKGYLFRLQQESPKPKPVICHRKEVISNRPPFYGDEYHGLISREEGELLCSEEGNFLIRESQTEKGRFTLVLRVLNAVKNYKLFYEDRKHFVGEKRFDSVHSLAEDGLITMFIESKAQDYIKRMNQEPVYDSLSRYSSVGKRHGGSGQRSLTSRYPKVPSPTDVDGTTSLYQRHDVISSSYAMKDVADVSFNPGFNAPDICSCSSCCDPLPSSSETFRCYQGNQFIGNVPYLEEVNLKSETGGAMKKNLTPTSSDERKRTKKRIATEEQVFKQNATHQEQFDHHLVHEQEELYRELAASAPLNQDAGRLVDVKPRRASYDHRGLHRNESTGPLSRRMSTDVAFPSKLSQCHRSGMAQRHLPPAAYLQQLSSGHNSERSQFARQSSFSYSFNAGEGNRLVDHSCSPYHQSLQNHVLPALNEVTSLDHLMAVHRQLEEEEIRHCDVTRTKENTAYGITQQSAEDASYHIAEERSFERNAVLRSSRGSGERHSQGHKTTNVARVSVRRTGSVGSCGSGTSNSSGGLERADTSCSNYTHDSNAFSSEEDGTCPTPRMNRTGILRLHSGPSKACHSTPHFQEKTQDQSPWEYRQDYPVTSPSIAKSTNQGDDRRLSRESDSSSLQETNHVPTALSNHNSTAQNDDQSGKRKPILRRANTSDSSPEKKKEISLKSSHSLKEKSSKEQTTADSHQKLLPSPTKSKKSTGFSSSPTSRLLAVMSPARRRRTAMSSSQCRNGHAEVVPHYDKEHHYKSHTYIGLQWCEYCGNFMWGLIQQGMQCVDCGLNVHKQCTKLVPNNCQPALKHVNRVFGTDLTTLVKLHGTQRPLVIDMCIEEIERRGLDAVGIYRVPGFHDDVMELKADFDQDGASTDLSCYKDINVVAGALKLYLRELPVPLIPYQLYSRFINAAKVSHEHGKLDAMRMGLNAMPAAHLQTLKFLIQHLGRVCERSFLNQMSACNLGVVLGPTILRTPEKETQYNMHDTHYQQEATETLIEHRHYLFGVG